MLRMNYFKEAYTLMSPQKDTLWIFIVQPFCFVNKYITVHFRLFFMGFQTLPAVQFLSFAGTLLVGLSNIRNFWRVGGRLFVFFFLYFFPRIIRLIFRIFSGSRTTFHFFRENLKPCMDLLYSLVPVYRTLHLILRCCMSTRYLSNPV